MTRGGWIALGLVARLLVGGLFVLTAVGKIGDLPTFAAEIQDYQMVPLGVTNAMAIVLPWLELLAGVLLILGVWRAENRWLIGLMLVVFTIAKAYAYFALGQTGSCGCGGDIAWLNTLLANPQGLLANVAMIGLLLLDALAQRRTDLGVRVLDESAGPGAAVA